MNRVRTLVLALVTQWFSVLSHAEPIPQAIAPEEVIREATVRMAVTYAIGWQYSGNVWKNGIGESAEVGQLGTSDVTRGVRAVCLGKETIDGSDFYVFFCLRSFVDPVYPSPVIQGSDFEVFGPDGNLFPKTKVETMAKGLAPEASDQLGVNWLTDVVRYGRIEFTGYENLGGGQFKVISKLPVTVFHDPGDVKVVNGKWFGHPEDTYNGGVYQMPNETFGVSEHFAMQRDAKEGRVAGLRFYEDHDAVLVYVPQAAYTGHEQMELPHHLGLTHPTLAVDLALRRPDQLFGFKYVLMGQETLNRIRDYQPTKYAGGGFGKAVNLLGLAMDGRTFGVLKVIDSALDGALPDPSKFDTWQELHLYYTTMNGADLGRIGGKVVSEMLGSGSGEPWWKRILLMR